MAGKSLDLPTRMHAGVLLISWSFPPSRNYISFIFCPSKLLVYLQKSSCLFKHFSFLFIIRHLALS